MSEVSNSPDQNVHNEMAPAWFNAEFFTNILMKNENTTAIELVSFKVINASNKTEHYGSLMFRATVDYRIHDELRTQPMIIKTMFEQEGHQRDLLKKSKIFNTEIGIYSKVVPKFEAILKAAGDDTKLAPRLFYHNLIPHQVLVFEDLSPLGYKVISERATNFEETKAVLTKIAKWHAVSYQLNLQQPQFLKPFQHNIFETVDLKNVSAFHDGINNFLELLESQADLKHYKTYFEPYVGKILDQWEKAAVEFLEDPQTDAYYVLCHGDFHHRNMMFKINEENGCIQDLLLLDFQLSYMGAIVNDILSSIFLIMNAEQRLQNLDELIFFYFEIFKTTLKKIGFQGPMPQLSELRKQMVKHKGYEIFLFTTFLPILMALDEGAYDIGQLMTDAKVRKQTFQNPNYIEQVRKLLPKYLYMGYLEI